MWDARGDFAGCARDGDDGMMMMIMCDVMVMVWMLMYGELSVFEVWVECVLKVV